MDAHVQTGPKQNWFSKWTISNKDYNDWLSFHPVRSVG